LYHKYIWELCPDHPKANPFGFVPQHRLIAERRLGHYLPEGILVHHDDHIKTNNQPDNLVVMTKSEHMRAHREEKRLRFQAPLDAISVEAALQRFRSTKKAAASLGVHMMTLHNRFPDLVHRYMRHAPHKPTDPETIERVLTAARDEHVGARDLAERFGISNRTAQRICERHGVPWRKQGVKVLYEQTVREALQTATSLYAASRKLRTKKSRLLREFPLLVAEWEETNPDKKATRQMSAPRANKIEPAALPFGQLHLGL
jgi:hypothetical protein